MESLADFGLTEMQLEIKSLCRRIGEEKIVPVREHHDETGEFPHDIVKVFAEAGLFGIFIPEAYGGMGGSTKDFVIAVEELCKYDAGIALALFGTGLGTLPIILCANEEQKKKYLPRIAEGTLAAFGLTEANAGSDAAAIQTTARKDGDYYVLNGTKQWITNGGESEIYTIVALTDPHKGARGASIFIVEDGDPGFSYGKKEDKMGIRSSSTRELILKDCRIPKDRLVGRRGTGFITVMKTLDMSRPGIASLGIGLAQAAVDEAVTYAKQRVQFGRPIISFQAVQHILADMAIQLEAGRALVYAAARHIDHHPKDMSKASSMCKVFATDMAMKVTTDAVQVLGGYGYMKEYPVEKMMRDAKILQIYEGTNQIQRNVVGQELNKEYS